MQEARTFNVAIVGGGPGCKAIMDMIFAEKLSQLRMNLIGLASTNPDTMGYRYAQERGIYTTKDYRDLYKLKDLNMIIELTGLNEVAKEIAETKPPGVRFIDHDTARVFWDLFQIEEERIAERRRSELEARRTLSLLRSTLESTTDGILVVGQSGEIVSYNQMFAEMWRIPESILQSRKDEKALAHVVGQLKDGQGFLDKVNEIYLKPEEASFDIIEFKDGRVFERFSVPQRLDGVPVGRVWSFRDVTDRKRAEEALRESEEKYRNLVERANDGIGIIQDGLLSYVNPRLAGICGYTVSEVVHKPFTDYVYPEGVLQVVENYRKRMKGEAMPPRTEVRLVHKDRHTLDTEISGGLITYQNKPADLIIVRDVTDRKRAEDALVRAKEDWENTFDAITDMVMLLDSEHRIIRLNKAAAEALDTTKEALVGKKCYEAVHRQSHPRSRCPLVETMKRLTPHTEEINEPNLGGTFICSTSPVLDSQGKLAGYTHTLKDVTEWKRLEAQFQQAQRLEAIGTLAGGIAHDFNNLLMGIQGNVSLMFLETDTAHSHFERLKSIERQIQSGAKLTAHLLGYARKGKYEVTPLNLNRLLEETSETFGRTRKDITIRLELAERLPAIEADPGQIEQVLFNLFVNAGDAMPAGGDLILKTANTTHRDMGSKLYDPKHGEYVLLQVTDTGMGMDKKTQERIFDPFFTTKEMGRGTGLGLASVYGIIKSHGGYIDVASQKGKGATFSIYLPASKKKVQRRAKVAERMLQGVGTVLLVDDEEDVLNVGKEMLETLGYRVVTAKDGIQAVDVYGNNGDDIDFVLLDLVMPRMAGGEAYDRMKEINPKVKVMLSSGYSLDGEAREILGRGCDAFIQKPFDLKELSKKIRETVDSKTA